MSSDKRVVNLSSFKLNAEQLLLLNRGLKFCPTPGRPDVGQLGEDLDKLHRRLRQIAFCDNPGSDPDLTCFIPKPDPDNLLVTGPFEHHKFKLKATGKGPPGPPNLEAMIATNQMEFISRQPPIFNYRDNLSPRERKALKELANNVSFIIRPADKGAATVLWPRDMYLKEGYRQLSDPDFYRKIPTDLTEIHRVRVNKFVEDMFQNGEIHENVKKYLLDISCRTSELYLLPKIHKNKHPPPGRPIISANGCPTEKISQFVDHFLNPAMQKLKSFVKDTTHFLRILSGLQQLPEDTLLVTLDVESLYTNIPIALGLEAAKITLQNTRTNPSVKPTNVSLLDLLKMVLTYNNFQFNGQHFLQISGTAMGTRVAVAYAVLALGLFEDRFVYTYHTQPLVYLRYIDDIFICWTKGRESLDLFIEHLNSSMECFNFTQEISSVSVNFLDTCISLDKGKLKSDLYSKPTDSHNYLRYDSAHPQRCKDSIPYSQFLRIRRICSDITDFAQHALTFKAFFLERGYPDKLLEEALRLAASKDRPSLLSERDIVPPDKDRVFLTTTYHPHEHDLRKMVYKNWSYLGINQTTNFLFQKKLMCGYRRPKNLRDHLVKAKVPFLLGDWDTDPTYTTVVPAPDVKTSTSMGTIQRSIKDFFKPPLPGTVKPSTSKSSTDTTHPLLGISKSSLLLTSTASKSSEKLFKPLTSTKLRGYSFCNRRGCRHCPLLDKTGTISSNITKERFQTMKNISCRSSNVIYSITCRICGVQYVGQTKNRLKDRFGSHFTSILNSDQDLSVGRHFSQRSHRGSKDMKIHILEFIKKPPNSQQAKTIRLKRESTWTHRLRSLAPLGLNMETPKEYNS